MYKTDASGVKILLIRDMSGTLTFPKGLMEQGENSVTTAIREAGEETGITALRHLTALPDVVYFYTRKGQSISKRVYYHLFVTTADAVLTPQKDEGITEAFWMPIDAALKNIGYEKSNTPVLVAAHEYIQRTQEKSDL